MTAFSIDFNRISKQDWWWGSAEWAFFLDDLKRHLNPGGQVFLALNPGRVEEGILYARAAGVFPLSRGARVEREMYLYSRPLPADLKRRYYSPRCV